MAEMKQMTATDWLFKQLWEEPKDKMVWYAILEQAKEMEKQEVIDAYQLGVTEGYNDRIEEEQLEKL